MHGDPKIKPSQFFRECLSLSLLLLLGLVVALDSAAQRFELKIVFESNRNGSWDIYAMNADGNNLVQLTDDPADDRDPAGSPDGRRISFTSMRHGPSDLYVMDSDGSNVVRLTNSNFLEHGPFWSPDGTKIAFTSFRVDNWEIYTIDTNGNNLVRLTRHQMSESSPSWSPDGRKIAFHSNPDGIFGSHHIFVMKADGTGVRNLTRNKGISNCRNPSWSPDGSRIAFNAWRGSVDIYVMTANGKILTRLTEWKGNNSSPSYSPDGARIAFVSDRGGGWDIYVMDSDGRRTSRLTRTPRGTESRRPGWLSESLPVYPQEGAPTSWGAVKHEH